MVQWCTMTPDLYLLAAGVGLAGLLMAAVEALSEEGLLAPAPVVALAVAPPAALALAVPDVAVALAVPDVAVALEDGPPAAGRLPGGGVVLDELCLWRWS